MKTKVKNQVKELGGTIVENKIYFEFDENVCDSHGEEIILKEAIEVENKMMEMGFEGALLGTVFNEGSDWTGIYFEIVK